MPLFRRHVSSLSELLKAQGELGRELVLLASLERKGRLETALAAEDPRLHPEYTKVWRRYITRREAHSREVQFKLEARKRVLVLETSKGVSRYRMAKDLGLNPGNLHAFLTKSNATKLSLDRAFGLVRYLEAA
jgi:hypothetical protein